jgi:hypothetical protein
MDTEVVKKKRGRKKKSESTEEPAAATTPPAKPKRGRKTKAYVEAYNVEGVNVNNPIEDENVIIRLNIKSQSNDQYAPPFPNAYNTLDSNTFSSTPMEYGKNSKLQEAASNATNAQPSTNADTSDVVAPNTTGALKVVELLKDFRMKNKVAEWPATTNISCYWCCNQFTNVPYGIPVKYCNGKFHVYGCFCSLECAMAYNFDTIEGIDEKLERQNLINLLARCLGFDTKLKPAPSRLALKMFGGYMDIDEFRSFCKTSKTVNVNFPPMMTLTQQVEEINDCNVNSEYKYIPLDHDRINKYKEKLTLKRSKPVTEFKNTLDHMMNLHIEAANSEDMAS